jgi:hypothetical protein
VAERLAGPAVVLFDEFAGGGGGRAGMGSVRAFEPPASGIASGEVHCQIDRDAKCLKLLVEI